MFQLSNFGHLETLHPQASQCSDLSELHAGLKTCITFLNNLAGYFRGALREVSATIEESRPQNSSPVPLVLTSCRSLMNKTALLHILSMTELSSPHFATSN
jgi:hypothetical protein